MYPEILFDTYEVTGQCDCDCACPSHYRICQSVPLASLWMKQPDLHFIALDDSWRTVYNPYGPVGIVVLNQPAMQLLHSFKKPASLGDFAEEEKGRGYDQVLAKMVKAGLLKPLDTPPIKESTSRVLSVWIHTTERCNLQCPYCYVPKRARDMCEDLAKSIVGAITKIALKYGYSSLKIKYAGGEPSLNFPSIKTLHHHFIQKGSENSLSVEEVMLTNGTTLTDQMLDFLAEAGIKVMISLDGGKMHQGKTRCYSNGESSFPQVMRTIKNALKRGLKPDISITITALNLKGALEAVALALDYSLPFNLNLYRPLGNFGEKASVKNGLDNLIPSTEKLMNTFEEIFSLVASRPDYPWPLTGILDRTHLGFPHSRPCAAGYDYLTVGVDGRVAPCQMLIGQAWARIDDRDPLGEIHKQGQDLFTEVDTLSQCKTCIWKYACGGGCPLIRHTWVSKLYCEIRKKFLPELARLEGLRIVHRAPLD